MKWKGKSAELQAWRGTKKRRAEKGQKKQHGRRHVLDLDGFALTNVDRFIQIRGLSMYLVAKVVDTRILAISQKETKKRRTSSMERNKEATQ